MTRVKPFSRKGVMLSGAVFFAIAVLAIAPWRLVAQERSPSEKATTEQTAGSGYDLSHVVHFEMGKKQFLAGDDIVIEEVRGTADTLTAGNLYEVKGTYKLSSSDKAMLGAFTTAPLKEEFKNVPTQRTQKIDVVKGQGKFTLLFYMWQDGKPHVSFYSQGQATGGVYFSTPENAQEAHDRDLQLSAIHLERIVRAMQTYLDAAGHFPPAKSGWGYDRTSGEWYRERPYLSWRVLILPILGENELFAKFKFNEPWDSENNRKLISRMPVIYRTPGSKAGTGKTNYLGVVGPNAAFPDKGTISVPDFVDGTSKTIMLVEVPDALAVEWTKPEDFPAATDHPMNTLVALRQGGFLSAFADACPQFISEAMPAEMLDNLLTRNDGKALDYGAWKQYVRSYANAAASEGE